MKSIATENHQSSPAGFIIRQKEPTNLNPTGLFSQTRTIGTTAAM